MSIEQIGTDQRHTAAILKSPNELVVHCQNYPLTIADGPCTGTFLNPSRSFIIRHSIALLPAVL